METRSRSVGAPALHFEHRRSQRAAPSNGAARASTCGQSSSRTAAKDDSITRSSPRTRSTTIPSSRARAAHASSSEDLPIPAGPSTSTTRPVPALDAPSRLASEPSSASRSSNSYVALSGHRVTCPIIRLREFESSGLARWRSGAITPSAHPEWASDRTPGVGHVAQILVSQGAASGDGVSRDGCHRARGRGGGGTPFGPQLNSTCSGLVGAGHPGQRAYASSPEFMKTSGLRSQQVQSEVAIERSRRIVTDDLAVGRSRHTRVCIKSVLEALSFTEQGTRFTLTNVSVTPLRVNIAGTNGSSACACTRQSRRSRSRFRSPST